MIDLKNGSEHVEGILRNLAMLLPFISFFVLVIIFISNQIFNTDIERHLYSNVEKFASHVLNVVILGVFIFMLLMLTLNTKIPEPPKKSQIVLQLP